MFDKFEEIELPIQDINKMNKNKRIWEFAAAQESLENFDKQIQYNIHIVAETPYYTKSYQPDIKANSEYIIDMVNDHQISKEELIYSYMDEIMQEFAKFGVSLPSTCTITLSQDKYLKNGMCISNNNKKIEDLRLKMNMYRDEEGIFRYKLSEIDENEYNEIKDKRR